MDSFKSFFNVSGTSRFVNGPRHRKSGFTDTDRYYRRKHLNLVADVHKADPSKNPKIEQLKKTGGCVPCTPADIQYITNTFNVEIDDSPKKLGNTGITIYRDESGNTVLRK